MTEIVPTKISKVLETINMTEQASEVHGGQSKECEGDWRISWKKMENVVITKLFEITARKRCTKKV